MNKRLSSAEEGIVSIIVTMIIMAVLSLIVVGFAQLARREQREALDKQLSTQAFYAAESGINDALRRIEDGTLTDNKPTCDSNGTPFSSTDILDNNSGVAYTCLIIDRTPSRLEFGSITVDKSTVVPINPLDTSTDPATPVPLQSLDISWNKSDNTGSGYYFGGAAASIAFPNTTTWDGVTGGSAAGILRLDLIPSDGGLSRATLADRMYTVFLYPGDTAPITSSISYAENGGGLGGSVERIRCVANNNPRKCKVSIGHLPSDTHYYARITSIYDNASVVITGTDALGRQVSFKDGQYVIDSTGKAGDVLKRIRVHKSAGATDYRYPTYAINSVQSICKQLEVYPARPAQGNIPAEPAYGQDNC